ncbi:MAG: sigma-70 family RNA polymerase sigma factor [Planctomycetes bacterium]|nr:sigma-70 family RNA polymerase sigma factor [Planctomycetota bacterium]
MADTPSERCLSEDRALAERANRGDRAALEALLERHAAVAARAAHAVLGRPDEALDAAQAALLRVARGFEAGQWSGGSVRAWVAACAHAAAVDAVRASSSRRRMEERVAGEAAVSGESAPPPEVLAEREETRAVLRQELARLPDATSQALALHHLQGLTVAQVAEHLGLSVDACKQRLHRGREELRERLMRRGIATAGVALVGAGLAALARSADAWAATLEPAALAGLVAGAARGAGEPIGSEGPPAETVVSPGAKFQMNAPEVSGGTSVVSNTAYSSGSGAGAGLLLLVAVLIGSACYYLLTASVTMQGSQAPTSISAPVLDVPRIDSPSTVPAAQGENPPAVAQPRWQAPRFVAGELVPVSVAASGRFVAVLAGAPRPVGFTAPLTLVESSDGGQTWRTTETFADYESGSVALDAEGNCAVLGLVTRLTREMREATGTEALKMMRDAPSPVRAEWRLRRAGGDFSSPEAVWETDGSGGEHLGDAKVYLAGGSVWAFALLAKPRTLMRHVVARSETLACPKPAGVWSGGGETCAWAADQDRAGFVITNKAGMLHVRTADGGTTWSQNAIAFAPEAGSNTVDKLSEPISLCHSGDRLALSVLAFQQPEGVDDVMKQTQTCYLLQSGDLGKSWMPRVRLTEPATMMEQLPGMPRLSLWSGGLAFGQTSRDGFGSVWKEPGYEPKSTQVWARVRFTADQGAHWFNQRLFEALGSGASELHFGSDGNALHVALYKKLEGQGGCLVIRSFAPGARAKAEGTPAWFKEEALAAPTPEEF